MNSVWLYSLASVTLVSLISLVGAFTLAMNTRKLNNLLLYLVSFSVGALLGDVFIHLLPEIFEEVGFGLDISLYILLGIALTFIIEKIIHLKHHHSSTSAAKHLHPASVTTLFGDGVHNFIDGMIIGASYLVSVPVGIATTLAVVLHEIPQEIGNFGVLIHGGYSKNKALLLNFISALTAVFGTVLALVIGTQVETFAVYLSAFTAGTFIYIAGADLIPELHKEVSFKKNLLQFAILIIGITTMLSLLLLE